MTIPSDGGLPDAAGPGASGEAPESGERTVPGESQGGAGMGEADAPIGFTADVGGEPGSTDDPEEARAAAVPAAAHGPRTDAERAEDEGDDGSTSSAR
jgi:hypothetical protein